MKYQKIIIFSIATIFIGAALYYVTSNRATLFNTPIENVSKQVEQTTLQTQSVTIGIVIYKVTPKSLTPNSETWDFEVSLDTHTGSLDQDLVSTVRLVDDKDNEYKPTKWIGDPKGGHHREGVLQFKSLGSDIRTVTLKIKPGENIEEASLTWEI